MLTPVVPVVPVGGSLQLQPYIQPIPLREPINPSISLARDWPVLYVTVPSFNELQS